MTNTFKATVISALTVAMMATVPMAAQADSAPAGEAFSATASFKVADTRGMDNRQDRRGDRQDCRGSEGVAGGDKRDCKQDSRTG